MSDNLHIREAFEAWYRDTYDGDSPDWDDVDLPLMYQCWRGGHRLGRREAFGEAGRLHDCINPACDCQPAGAGAMRAVIEYRDKIDALAAKEEA